MKLLQFPSEIHHKNAESMKRMCCLYGIDYEITNDIKRLLTFDYAILWLPTLWIPPNCFPPEIKLFYGPQHFVFPEGHPICGPRDEEQSKRAVYTSLSPWVQKLYSEFTEETVIPFAPLPLGVELKEPRNLDVIPFNVLVYGKNRSPSEKTFVKGVLDNLHIPYEYFQYGSYKDKDYQDAIKRAHFCIWIGRHESQGFAFQECLAQNVPILCLSTRTMFEECDDETGAGHYEQYRGKKKLEGYTASYWSNECGICITNINEFVVAFKCMIEEYRKFKPREFIKSELSDEVCMARILSRLGVVINQ